MPGVGITATNTLTGKKYATTTDVTGAFAMAIPRNGRYVVKAELAAFASDTKEVLIKPPGRMAASRNRWWSLGCNWLRGWRSTATATGCNGRGSGWQSGGRFGAGDAVA